MFFGQREVGLDDGVCFFIFAMWIAAVCLSSFLGVVFYSAIVFPGGGGRRGVEWVCGVLCCNENTRLYVCIMYVCCL